jgi:hypothetical protein
MIDPELVKGFEYMAKRARKGKVIAVAMSFVDDDYHVGRRSVTMPGPRTSYCWP